MVEIIGGILGGGVIYILTGYLVFRGWVRASPAQRGEFATDGEYDNYRHQGWFVPTILSHEKKLDVGCADYAQRLLPKGTALVKVLWVSVFCWPGVLVTFGSVLGGRAVGRAVTRIALGATNAVIVPITETSDPVLIAAEQEVEQLLKPEAVE